MLLVQPLGCLKVLDEIRVVATVCCVTGAVDGVAPPEGGALKSSFDGDEEYQPIP